MRSIEGLWGKPGLGWRSSPCGVNAAWGGHVRDGKADSREGESARVGVSLSVEHSPSVVPVPRAKHFKQVGSTSTRSESFQSIHFQSVQTLSSHETYKGFKSWG